MGPLKTRKGPGGSVHRTAVHPPEQRQPLQPDRYQRAPGAADAAQPGQPAVAKHEQPVKHGVDRAGQQGNHHHRLGLVDAGAVAIEYAVGGEGRQGAGRDRDELGGHQLHRRFELHVGINQRGQQRQRHGDQTGRQPFPQPLAHQVRNFVMLARTHVVCHQRVDRQQQSQQREDDQVPDRDAEGHPGEVLCRSVSGHGHVGHRHADRGQLAHQDGPGQCPQGAGFLQGACAHTGHRRLARDCSRRGHAFVAAGRRKPDDIFQQRLLKVFHVGFCRFCALYKVCPMSQSGYFV